MEFPGDCLISKGLSFRAALARNLSDGQTKNSAFRFLDSASQQQRCWRCTPSHSKWHLYLFGFRQSVSWRGLAHAMMGCHGDTWLCILRQPNTLCKDVSSSRLDFVLHWTKLYLECRTLAAGGTRSQQVLKVAFREYDLNHSAAPDGRRFSDFVKLMGTIFHWQLLECRVPD